MPSTICPHPELARVLRQAQHEGAPVEGRTGDLQRSFASCANKFSRSELVEGRTAGMQRLASRAQPPLHPRATLREARTWPADISRIFASARCCSWARAA